MFLTTVRLILLSCLLRCGLFVGKILASTKRSKRLDLRDLSEIIINRTDRIGDAVLSRPLIELFCQYGREKGFRWTYTLLVSPLNAFVFTGISDIDIRRIDTPTPEYVSGILGILKKIRKRLLATWLVGRRGARDTQRVMLDFMANGDALIPLESRKKEHLTIVGLNALTSTILYDRALPRALVHRSQYNLIETYIDLIACTFTDSDDFRTYVYAHFDDFYTSLESAHSDVLREDFDLVHHAFEECFEWRAMAQRMGPRRTSELLESIQSDLPLWRKMVPMNQRKDILVFVGVFLDRSFPGSTWKRLICDLASAFPDEIVRVMDGPDDTMIHRLKELGEYPKNVIFDEKVLPLKVFALFAARHRWVIGADGGGINFVRRFTNSLSLFTFANPLVWWPFVGASAGVKTLWKGGWYWQEKEGFFPQGNRIAQSARHCLLLPTFNVSSAQFLVAHLDTELVAKMMRVDK